MKQLKYYNLFYIFLFIFLFIFLCFFIYVINLFNLKIENFDVSNTKNNIIDKKILNDKLNKLEEQRKIDDIIIQKEFIEYVKKNKDELDKYLNPSKENEEVKISNENSDYQSKLINFYQEEKNMETIRKQLIDEELNQKILNKKNNRYTIDEYQKMMLKNKNNKKLYKIKLNNIELLQEDCFEKCDNKECIKMNELKKNLDKCLKCNSQENKCFKKTIIGGICDDCNVQNQNEKIDCYNIQNFGCTNPLNIDYNRGVEPYFIQLNNDDLNTPYNKKCVFCWNISNEL